MRAVTAHGDVGHLEELRQRFSEWRVRRTRGEPIPEELWAEAASLARWMPMSTVARALGLGFSALKRRMGDHEDRTLAQGGFVELPGGHIGQCPAAGVVLELLDPGGLRLTVRLPPGERADLGSLVAAFRGVCG